ncbi:hypothetical protein [Zunongwangia endophytica]|uniref:Signal transducer regulating beta-lactamase production, contains metallopeptidase domain n=1 Tax=Zunongwangia endophytica TaxID=1808945 RepID=A0ABV8HA36_9FLAO|nr:hypothetical protein [Zunongwangia endophytica]MDN3595357.1 hypothetical protein [Zunongwangia endophytica]
MILVNKHILGKNFIAVTIWPVIFVKTAEYKEDELLVNHEKIHLKQQLELLVVFFYIFYVAEFLFRWIKYRDSMKAYQNISFEVEAYTKEKDEDYLTNRKAYSFLKYFL